MTITKAQLQQVIKKAYSLGYDDCANQSGYNIAVQSRLINPRVARRPKDLSVKKVYELAVAEIDKPSS